MESKQKKKIYRQTLTDGKRIFTVVVPVWMDYFLIDGKWEEAISCKEWRKVEVAIETQYPGWFHTCYNSPKQHCRACTREVAQRLTNKKSLVN